MADTVEPSWQTELTNLLGRSRVRSVVILVRDEGSLGGATRDALLSEWSNRLAVECIAQDVSVAIQVDSLSPQRGVNRSPNLREVRMYRREQGVDAVLIATFSRRSATHWVSLALVNSASVRSCPRRELPDVFETGDGPSPAEESYPAPAIRQTAQDRFVPMETRRLTNRFDELMPR